MEKAACGPFSDISFVAAGKRASRTRRGLTALLSAARRMTFAGCAGHGYHSVMGTSIKPLWTETLPEPLPANPLEIVVQWLAEAQIGAAQPNPNAMVLATVNEHGQPSARVVLCKGIVPEKGYIVFYTNYQSHKGRDLESNPRAAVVFHWDHQHRQVRAEGRVERLSDAENDAYFDSRPWQSRLGAWASRAERAGRVAHAPSRRAWPPRRAASAFPTTAPAPRSPRQSGPRCLARLTGADIA